MKNLNIQPEPTQTNTTSTQASPQDSEKTNYDFTGTQTPSSSLQTYSDNKKAELNDKIFNPKYNNNKSAIWIMLTLILCLTGLCGFTTYQIYQYEKALSGKTVINNVKDAVIIAGDGFSFVIDEVIPSGFAKETQRLDFEWLENKKGVVNNFLSKETLDSEENINGISVYSSEFDSKLSKDEFATKVATKIGDGYKIDPKNLVLSNNITLTHIKSTNQRIKINYYTAVNSSNYYVIKVYTMGKDNPKNNNKAEFTKNLLQNLRLN